MAARGPASRGARGASPKKLIGAGNKAYEWLKEALGVYGTAVTVVQLVPAVLALLAVFLTPTAWLSATLRRWVGLGALAGALVGMALFARAAGPQDLRGLVRGGAPRSGLLAGLGWWGLGVGVVAAAAFRFHLAVIDVAFVSSAPFLTPLLDYYLGGGPAAATLYNLLAAVLAGTALAGFGAGAPAALLRWRERRLARRALLEDGGALAALERALSSLEAAKAAVVAAKAQVADMAVELEDLRAAAGGRSDGPEAAARGAAPPATSAAGRPGPPAPRAADGRRRR